MTAGDVFDKISTRQVSFEMVAKVFKDMTSEGGKFYKMQEVQAETLKGKLSNLTDAFQIMLSEVGDKNSGIMKGSVEVLYKLIENYEKLGRAIITVVSAYAAYKGAVAAANMVDWFKRVAKDADRIRNLGVDVSNAALAMRRLGISMKMLNFATVSGAIVGITMGIYQIVKAAGEMKRKFEEISKTKLDGAVQDVNTFKETFRQMKNMTQGSEEYREAIAKLNRVYGEYLPNLLTEKTTLGELEAVEKSLTASIYNRAKAYAYAEGNQVIGDKLLKKTKGATEEITNYLTKAGKSEESATAFIQKFRDNIVGLGDASSSVEVFAKTYKEFFGMIDPGSGALGELLALNLGRAFVQADKEAKKLKATVESTFSNASSASTSEELDAMNAINREYEQAVEDLKKLKMSTEEYNAEVKRLDVTRVSNLVDLFERLSEDDGGVGARNDQFKIYQAQLESMTAEVKGWAKDVDKILAKFGFSENNSMGGLWADNNTSALSYIEKVKKAYKELPLDDVNALAKMNEKEATELRKQASALREIAAHFGIVLDAKAVKASENKEHKALEAKVSNVKMLMEEYRKIKELGIDDATATEWLNAFSPDTAELNKTLRFKEVLMGLADTLETVYQDANGAQAIRNLFPKESIDEMVSAYTKLESLRDKLQSWLTEDFNIDGEGIVFDINKLAADLNTKNNGVSNRLRELKEEFRKAVGNEEALAAIRKKYGEEAWMEYIKNGEDSLDALAQKEIDYNKKVVMEKIRDIAKGYVDEWDGLTAFELSNWADKNIMEIRNIQKAIDEFDPSSLPEGLENAVKGAGGDAAWEDFIRKFKEALAEIKKKAEEQEKKGSIRTFKNVARVMKEMASSASDLADALGATELAEGVKVIAQISEGFSNFFEAGLKGDVIGMVTAGLQTVLQVYVATKTAANELAEGIRQAKIEAREYAMQVALSEGVETIFGDNALKNISNAARAMKKLGTTMDENKKKTTLFYQAFDKTTGTLSLSKGQRKFDIKKEIEKLGYELYDSYGNLNAEALQALLNTYSNLDKESRDWLENAISDSKAYAEAMSQLENSVKDVFGNIADDMASSFIDKYLEIGDATADLANQMDNIFGDLAQSIANELVSAFILDNVLSKYEGEAKSMMERMASGDADETEIAQYFSTLADGIKNDTEAAAEYTNRLLDALTAQGVTLGSESESSNSLSNGIKSITEDTANLLASYVNAIRADVAASRVSLTDIQTNTFRSAIAAEGILSKLESVMGSFSGGGDGIKVVVQ